MKIALVRPNQHSRFQITPPLSLGYLSASLKANGYNDVFMVDASLDDLTPQQVFNRIIDIAHLVCIQIYSGDEEWARELCWYCASIHLRTVVGGPHFSATYDKCGADIGIKGEGENAIIDLLTSIKEYNINPAMFASIIDVNKYPIPDWSLIDPRLYQKYQQSANIPVRGKIVAPVLTSRGCPHRCTFCSAHTVHGYKVRMRDVGNILTEIELLKKNYGVDEISFCDDNLTYDKDRAKLLFTAMLYSGVHWKAPNGIRIDTLDEEMVALMKKSGCYMVGVGIETGSEAVRYRIKKKLSNAKILAGLALLKQYGIMTSGFFMVGFPCETEEEIQESIDFALGVPLDRIQVCQLEIYPGSELEGSTPIDRKAWQKKFYWAFYLRPRIIWSLIKNLRWSQLKAIFTHPAIRGWFK